VCISSAIDGFQGGLVDTGEIDVGGNFDVLVVFGVHPKRSS